MRKFQIKEWEYSLKVLSGLAEKKNYYLRFRLEYALLLRELNQGGSKFALYLRQCLVFYRAVWETMAGQFSRAKKMPVRYKSIILLSDNATYLMHLLPVVNILKKKGMSFILLCPRKHKKKLLLKLDAELHPFLLAFEELPGVGNAVGKIFRFVRSLILTGLDSLFFIFSTAKKSLWVSPAFCGYAFTQHYFSTIVKKRLAGVKQLIAANDHWLWESLFFQQAIGTVAHRYVLQHGVPGDVSYPLLGSQYLAWGEATKNTMVNELGAMANEIIVAGSPYYDELFKRAISGGSAASKFSKPFITFLGQPFFSSKDIPPQQYHEFLDWFSALRPLAESTGKKLVLKLHPLEDVAQYSHMPDFIQVTKNNLLNILSDTCICLTVDSTALLQACMMQIPVMQLAAAGISRDIDFSNIHLTKRVISQDDLLSHAGHLLRNENFYREEVNHATAGLHQYFANLGSSGAVFEELLMTEK